MIPPIVLASRSPRRRQLMEALGISFRVEPPKVSEELASSKNVDSVAMTNASTKAKGVFPKTSSRYVSILQSGGQISSEADIILGADTLVVLDHEVLGKPRGKEDVIRSLAKLSGRTHLVVTGICLLSKHFGIRQAFARSHVQFRTLSEEEIAAYSTLEEPYDKAGAYAVQGMGALFIKEISGSYTNVMGLPIELLLAELLEFTRIPISEWFPRKPSNEYRC